MPSFSARARLLVVAAAVLFSTGGASIKGTSLNAWQVSGFRSAVAAAAILLLVPDARRGWRFALLPPAAAYAATLILFVTATKLTTAANAIFLQDTAPLFMLLLGPLVLHERVRRTDLLFMAVIGGGLAMFFTGAQQSVATAPDPARGDVLALISALTWALTLTALRAEERGHGERASAGMAVVAIGNLLVALAAMPLAFPLPNFRLADAAVIAWLGIFQIGLAYLCLTRGVRSVTALETTTILLLEPALNPIFAWLVHGENPGGRAVAGGALIAAATLTQAWWNTREPKSLLTEEETSSE